MPGSSTSTVSNLLRPNVAPELNDLLFRETDFLNLLRAKGRVRDGIGGSPYKWLAISSANSSTEVFAEGQAPPVAGRQTYQQPSVAAFYVRGVAGITGHMRDNLAKGAYYASPLVSEYTLIEADVFKKLEDELVGSTADRGIASIVDSTGEYAGINQSTVAEWASEENALVGTLTVAALQTLYEEMHSGTVSSVPRNATPTNWLMPINQVMNYFDTVGPTASTSLWRINSNGGAFDAGVNPNNPTFMGIPISVVRGITSTEIYLLDLMDFELLVQRDLRADPIVGNPEMEQVQVSFAVAVKAARRNKHGKMTGVTA